MIREAIAKVVEGGDLSAGEAAQVMGEIMGDEATPAQLAAFLTALRVKGETLDEITGMAGVMRSKGLSVDVEGPLVDTCGTGGDASHTFNISTTVGLVAAGAGVKVAKHGNRAASGSTGSADVLEELGVNIALGPEGVARCIDEAGFGFMFAQTFHPAMRFAAGPRREIGIRTIFNTLGPLMNPAGVTAQVFGMADPGLAGNVAQFLHTQGVVHALLVHGQDGLDEVSLAAPTDVWDVQGGRRIDLHRDRGRLRAGQRRGRLAEGRQPRRERRHRAVGARRRVRARARRGPGQLRRRPRRRRQGRHAARRRRPGRRVHRQRRSQGQARRPRRAEPVASAEVFCPFPTTRSNLLSLLPWREKARMRGLLSLPPEGEG